MTDVVALGELLIDFACQSVDEKGYPTMAAHPGGAPANFLAALAKFGAKAALLGKVGTDAFGKMLTATLQEADISTEGLIFDDNFFTTLAFVTFDETGDRAFSFARKPGADTQISFEELKLDMIDEAKILHISCVYDKGDPGYDAVDFALDYAQKNGKIISCDPNYRPGRWDPASGYAREYYREILSRCHLIKVSEEEMSIVTGVAEDQVEEGAKLLMELGVEKKAVFVTLGSKGAYYITPEEQGYVPGFKVDAVDTTGCGDSFMGSMHYFMCYEPDMPMAEKVRRANAVGALCALTHGAFDAMPTPEELEAFLAEQA